MGRAFSPTDDLQLLREVVADEDLSTPERMAMVSLVLHRNGETGHLDPSVPTIAAESGLGRSTVIRVLAQLEARGWLIRDQRHGRRTRYSIPTRPGAGLVSERDQSQSGTRPVPERDQSSPAAGPERTKERTKERTNGIAGDLWQAYVEEFHRPRMALTDTRRKKLAALHTEQLASESDPVAAFRRILHAVKASPHHMGNPDYHTPESLFRSPERRETWAEKGRNGAGPRDPLLMSTAELRR